MPGHMTIRFRFWKDMSGPFSVAEQLDEASCKTDGVRQFFFGQRNYLCLATGTQADVNKTVIFVFVRDVERRQSEK